MKSKIARKIALRWLKDAGSESYFRNDPEKGEVRQLYYGKIPPTPKEIKKGLGGKQYSTLNRYLISPSPSSLKNANSGNALDYLKIYVANPNRENQKNLNYQGTELLRKSSDPDYIKQGGATRRDLAILRKQELDRLDQSSIPPNEKGLRQYLRLSRRGSFYRMTRPMRIGMFLIWVSKQPLSTKEEEQREQDFQDAAREAFLYWRWMADNGYKVRKELRLVRKHLGTSSESVASYLSYAIPRIDLLSLSPTEKKVLNQVFSASKVYGKPLKYRIVSKTASMDKVALRLRQMERLLDMGGDFGILSAYGPYSKKVNQQRHGQLVAELQRRGYRRFTNLKGSWEGVAEKALMVPDMSYRDLFEIGRVFDQISVIYKNIDGIIGMYYLRDSTAEIAVDPETNEAAYQISLSDDLYSKSRSMSFEFDFLWGQKVPWDGRTPINSRQVKRLFGRGLLEAA